jgi:hypothetical protein
VRRASRPDREENDALSRLVECCGEAKRGKRTPIEAVCRRARSHQGQAWRWRERPALTRPALDGVSVPAVGARESLRRGRTREMTNFVLAFCVAIRERGLLPAPRTDPYRPY